MFLETLLCEEGEVMHLAYHQQRLDKTLSHFTLPCTYDLKHLITPPFQGRYRCRFLYDGLGCSAEYIPYTPKRVTALRAVMADDIDYPFKSTDRKTLDLLYPLRQECDDVLIIRNGYITDTTIANIALFDGTTWLTPDEPLLEGTTRARLLKEGFLVPAPLRLEDIRYAKKVAVMNALMGFVEVENGIII